MQCCYFVRSGDKVDTNVDNDTSLLYGEIAASPLKTIEAMLSSQYVPLFSMSSEWGHANREQKSEFSSEMDQFAANISSALESLSCGLDLKSYDNPLFDSTNVQHQQLETDQKLVQDMEKVLEEWCEGIESYLSAPFNDAQSSSKKSKKDVRSIDAGPKGELDFWRTKMQRLNSITEHVQSEQCDKLVHFLSSVFKRSGDRHGTKIPGLLGRWKQIDVSVTEASNESKDNIKYLSSLQRFVGPLYNGNIQGMIDAIPALLNSVKVSA